MLIICSTSEYVGKSSQCHDLVVVLEFFLVYKFCHSLDILIGLQWNTPYSKSNQCATQFLQQNNVEGMPWRFLYDQLLDTLYIGLEPYAGLLELKL